MTGVPRRTGLCRHQNFWEFLGRPAYSGTNTAGCSDLSTLAPTFLGGGPVYAGTNIPEWKTRLCRHQHSKTSQGRLTLLEWCGLCWGATEPELKEDFICKIWQQGYTYGPRVTLATHLVNSWGPIKKQQGFLAESIGHQSSFQAPGPK